MGDGGPSPAQRARAAARRQPDRLAGGRRGSAGPSRAFVPGLPELLSHDPTTGRPTMTERRPNIVMILTDDHGAQTIGAYGSVVNTTPRIDEIAEAGGPVDNCFVAHSPWPPRPAANLPRPRS